MPRRSLLWMLSIPLIVGLVVSQAQPKERFYKEFTQFSQILDIVLTRYVDEVNAQKLFEGAYRGMLQELDPYSQFLNAEHFQEFKQDTAGKFSGLGIEIGLRDGILTVITPISGSPAWNAGIMPGDRILYIDGKSTERITLQEAVKTLRGEEGAKVTLTIRHPESNLDTNITIVRATIKPAAVESKIVRESPKIGLIRVHSFTGDMMKDFDKTAEQLKKDNIEAVILDLRGNPGGILDEAVALADRFLDKGVIVTIKGRGDQKPKEYAADAATLFGNIPLVVLVDGGSASASEIAAAALQQDGRALVVGTTTFGKGAVQSVIEIEGGAVKLTTAMYYTPNGKPISREHPVEPDVTINMPTEMLVALREQEVEGKMRGSEKQDTEKKELAPNQPPTPAPNLTARRKLVKDIQLEGAASILAAQVQASRAAAASAMAVK
jgi:carboxyl-terminal processing protease